MLQLIASRTELIFRTGKIPPLGFLLEAYLRSRGILERVFLEKRTPKFAISLVEVNGLCNRFAESC